MLVVPVVTPFFTADVLHMSEMPDDVRRDITQDSTSVAGEVFGLMAVCILDPEKSEQFQDLTFKEALAFFNQYRLTAPVERDITDGLLR